jgi:hypothetical protein
VGKKRKKDAREGACKLSLISRPDFPTRWLKMSEKETLRAADSSAGQKL